jgi:pimeloyl-ACP methyl ester carboxylesterase
MNAATVPATAAPVASHTALARVVELPQAIGTPRREFTSSQAGRISYYRGGTDSGKPLVLVHGINAAPSAFEMKPLFEHFRTRRPVFALDLPGFGFSDRSDRRYTPELFTVALLDFLTQVVKEPVDLAAFSLGSEFAARAILREPECAASLVLISPTGFSDRALPSPRVGAGLYRALSLPGLSQGLFDLLTTRPSIRYFLGQAFFGATPREMVEYCYATSHQPGARYAPVCFLSGQLFTPNAHKELYAKLQLPVLVLYDQDPNVSFEHLPAVLSDHANWRAERVVPTRGIPQWEKPEETAAAMGRFWQAISGPHGTDSP